MLKAAKLKSEKLSLSYGKMRALSDVSMEIRPHEVTALIGPSGSGKTTFLKVLNRMTDLVPGVTISGQVTYDGVDVFGDCDVIELRKRIGMVFQKPNPFPMSIFNNVAYGPRVHGEHRRSVLTDIVEESLRRAALWDEVKDRLASPAPGLSGGQQQRLCIARLLAVEPDVILMDEPTASLDPISTMKIEDLIDGLKKSYTIVIVTHNLQQACRISEVTAFFLGGELIEIGRTEEMFFTPKNKRTEDYITGRFG